MPKPDFHIRNSSHVWIIYTQPQSTSSNPVDLHFPLILCCTPDFIHWKSIGNWRKDGFTLRPYPIVGSRQVWHISGSRKNSIARHITHGHEYDRPSHRLICRSVCMPRETLPSFEVKKLVEPINTWGSRDLTRYNTGRRIRCFETRAWAFEDRSGYPPLTFWLWIRAFQTGLNYCMQWLPYDHGWSPQKT